MTAILAFSTLLTWIFILYQPTSGPGELQRLGWQAWSSVSMGESPASSDTDKSTSGSENSTPGNHEGVDWWNTTTEERPTDTSSLPLDVWSPLLPHDTGCKRLRAAYHLSYLTNAEVTEITIEKCIFPPSLSYLCGPKTTAEQDAIKGKWVRVERDLNMESGLWSLVSILYHSAAPTAHRR